MRVGEKDKTFSQFMGLFGNVFGMDTSEFVGLAGSGENAGDEDEGEDSGSDAGGEERYWPRKAKHRPDDFKEYLSLGHSSVWHILSVRRFLSRCQRAMSLILLVDGRMAVVDVE